MELRIGPLDPVALAYDGLLDSVYQGNVENATEFIANYINTYAEYIYAGPEHQVDLITAQDLYDIFKDAQQSSAGMDSWGHLI